MERKQEAATMHQLSPSSTSSTVLPPPGARKKAPAPPAPSQPLLASAEELNGPTNSFLPQDMRRPCPEHKFLTDVCIINCILIP